MGPWGVMGPLRSHPQATTQLRKHELRTEMTATGTIQRRVRVLMQPAALPNRQLLRTGCQDATGKVAVLADDRARLPSLAKQGCSGSFPYQDASGQPSFASSGSADPPGKYLCLVCQDMGTPDKYVLQEKMRMHIGQHIIKGHISGLSFGFCGQHDCTPCLEHGASGTKEKPKWQLAPSSCKRYYKSFYYQPALNSGSNVPVHCPAPGCNVLVWKYGMAEHYDVKHSELELPEDMAVEMKGPAKAASSNAAKGKGKAGKVKVPKRKVKAAAGQGLGAKGEGLGAKGGGKKGGKVAKGRKA